MSRPRRAAAKKSQERLKENKIDLGLSEDDEEEMASENDFSSGSSDEYDPEKSKSKGGADTDEADEPSSEDEHEDEEEEEESFMTSMREKMRKSKGRGGNRSLVASLRKSAINKFKAKQSVLNRSSGSSQKLQDILKKAQFNKRKEAGQSDESDNEKEKTPDFDCSAGVNLSDSSDSDDDNNGPIAKRIIKKPEGNDPTESSSSINENSGSNMVDLKTIHDNLQQIKSAKEKLTNYKSSRKQQVAAASGSQKENMDIAGLLAMGEDGKKSKSSQKRRKASQGDDSDSDNWEDVEDSNHHAAPKKSVEIFLNEFGENQGGRKQAKPVDIEAQMKRKFNKRRKEIQEYLHKSELMCWIAHCSFVNKRLNNTDLMNAALQMLPSNNKQCYPKEKTDVDYFQQVTKWFKSMMKLKDLKMYCERLKKRPPLMMSLAIQMKYKAAICRRDYILIYITLLRALGIQCRMVQSVVCDPKICPKSELMSLSMKKPAEKNTTTGSNESAESSKLEKIPQLDGVDDLPERKKVKKPQLKLRGASEFKVDESYVHVSEKDLKAKAKSHAGNLSPKISITLNSPNRVQKPISDTLAKPRKTKEVNGAQRPAAPTGRSTRNGRQVKDEEKKEEFKKPARDELKLLSPRRLRSRSRSNDNRPSTSAQALKKDVQVAKSKSDQPKKTASSPVSRPSRNSSKDNQPSTSAQALKRKAEDEEPKPAKMDTLQVVKPISQRLRSRSRSDDNRPKEDAAKPAVEKEKVSRKRAAAVNDEVDNKKLKLTDTKKKAVKRSAAPPSKTVVSKKSKKQEKHESDSDEDSDDSSLKYFKTAPKSKTSSKASTSKAAKASSASIDRRILSSDEDVTTKSAKSKGIDIWVEVYSEKDEKWIAIDVYRNKIDCVKEIVTSATHPLVYVFAFNNDNSVKDVSARYCENLNTTVRKMRVDGDYLSSILNIFPGTRTVRDFKEDDELNKLLLAVPMPKSIAEFKNHPLYALKRHLLKYQAIYPPEPPVLGMIRDEAIYPRDCVFTLHSRETWLKEARVVKLYETPYKIVKTLKWNNQTKKLLKDVPLELFGMWQTKEYEPPTAENGLVPRNGYGNVELFKPQMLPHGTVHLQLPGLQKVCKKLRIDCAQAVVGFDSNGGWPFPVYDGFVVCKEFEEKVIDAWNREQEENERKEREKIDKRVYGNWKKLIKGLLIRERLKQKYDFENVNK